MQNHVKYQIKAIKHRADLKYALEQTTDNKTNFCNLISSMTITTQDADQLKIQHLIPKTIVAEKVIKDFPYVEN